MAYNISLREVEKGFDNRLYKECKNSKLMKIL